MSQNNSDNDNNNILKKQKINNNNEEDSGSEIDITNLIKQTVIQLKGIASTLGISIKHGIKKNDIIEQIKIVYKRKQDILDKQEYENNINSFNKVIEFKIKDNIDPLEWLFWKVFRNKFIYKKIMSNMNTQLSTPYHSIISITNMIKFDQLNLLRDKVIRNQYLVFGRDKYNGFAFKEIFGVIRNDDDQDRLFYQQLFKHYGQYSLEFNNVMVKENGLIDNENGRELLVNDTIATNCISALQVLIQHYQYTPTIGNLGQAIVCDRLKFVKLLLQPQFNLQIYNLDEEITIKILNHLYDEKLIDNKMVKAKLIALLKNIIIEEYTLKSLIGMSQLILKCINNNIRHNHPNTITIEPFSNSSTKQELKSTLSDKSNQIEPKKEMIKKLLQLYYSFLNVKKSQFYYIYFSGGDDGETYSDSDIGIRQNFKEAYLSFLRFADLKLVSSINNESISFGLVRECFHQPFGQMKEPDFLFSHCQDDKDKQMEFLNYNIGRIKERTPLIDQRVLFNLVIYNDDLDQIKYVSKELGASIKECQEIDASNNFITNYIRSKLVLEWLFENHYSYFIVDDGATIWYFRSVELLQHFEKLYQLKCKSDANENNGLIRLTIPNQDEFYENQPCNINVLKHIFKCGSTVYYQKKIVFNDEDDYEDLEYNYLFSSVIYKSDYGTDNQFELLKLAFLNFGGMDVLIGWLKHGVVSRIHSSDSFARFIDWIYRNYQHEFNNSEILKNGEIIKRVLLKTGVFIGPKLANCVDYILSNANECKTELLDFILKSTQATDYKKWVNFIILNACTDGKLKTIQHIHQNYSWLLVKKSNSNPNGLFITKELNLFLLESLSSDKLAVSDYLFDLFSTTKKQFDDNSGDLSKLYYRNKTFK